MEEGTTEGETTILPFPVLPIVQQPKGWNCQEDAWVLLWNRINQSKAKTQKWTIGDGYHTTFAFDLPFSKIISWRVVSPAHEVVHPDCLLKGNRLTVVFGEPPAVNEFDVEILGICD